MKKNYKQLQREAFSAEFKKFCRKNIQTPMNELEKKRKNHIIGLFITALIGAIAEGFSLYFIYIEYIAENITKHTLTPAIMVPFLFVPLCMSIIKKYKNKAKEIILPKLLSYLGEFEITPSNCIHNYTTDYIQTLDLLPSFDVCKYDDCFHGTYNDVKLGVSELKLKEIHYDSKGRRHEHIVFQGLFVCTSSFKKFNSRTIIKRDGGARFAGDKRVHLEDPEFEKYFDVISSDQIEARYLITPAFMNRMVELNRKGIGRTMSVSFENDNINIAIASSKDWFEIPLFKPATEIANYRAILLELISIFSIIDTLKLDQNIGA